MAQTDVKGLDVADVYAAALYEIAAPAGNVDSVRAELEALVELAGQKPELAAFLASAAIDADDRAVSLERIFRGRLSDLVLNALLVMDRRGRLSLWRALLRAYVLRVEEARGQLEVTATSAVPLAAAQRAEIEQLAATLAGKQPVMEYAVDPELIGGLVLQMGDRRLDNSVRRHLYMARARLLERTNRGSNTE